jgi:hypothetical protein
LCRTTAYQEPQVRIELTTARLRIECSTTELLWREVLLCPDSDSNRDALRHHPLKMACLPVSPPGHCTFNSGPYFPTTGATGLEPATSRVTVECSNQTELRPLWIVADPSCIPSPAEAKQNLPALEPCMVLSNFNPPTKTFQSRPSGRTHSPNGSRTRLCTLKGCRPNR